MECSKCKHRGEYRNDDMVGYECKYTSKACPLEAYQCAYTAGLKKAMEIAVDMSSDRGDGNDRSPQDMRYAIVDAIESAIESELKRGE